MTAGERVPTLYVSGIFPADEIAATVHEHRLLVRTRPLNLQAHHRASPALYLLDASSAEDLLLLRRLDGGNAAIVVDTGRTIASRRIEARSIVGTLPSFDQATLGLVLRLALDNFHLRSRLVEAERRSAARRRELDDLNEIGLALSTEPNIDDLYRLILDKARQLTGADGASLYLIEGQAAERQLRFKLSQTMSGQSKLVDQVMPLSPDSIAGYVALSGESLRIRDAYAIPEDAPYSFNPAFDRQTGYRTSSVLTCPMTTTRGEVVGVIQLINRKRHAGRPLKQGGTVGAEVLPFTRDDTALARSFGSQAAVALENRKLIDGIRTQFEGFVNAAVTAIEARDPTTSGHSSRVAILTVSLAEALNAIQTGAYRDVHFTFEELRAIRYASLLHDFGKVGVREHVLVKAKKLYDWQSQLIDARFHAARQASRAAQYRRRALREPEPTGCGDDEELAALDRLLELVRALNEPRVVETIDTTELDALAGRTYVDVDGIDRPLLLPNEVVALGIRRGTLNAAERQEIESHVEHSFRFLSQIPWTRDLGRVPEIAHRHHERLNGQGYPQRLTAAEIPIESRMMAIADVYDALTAQDRPYKKAVRPDDAIAILYEEAANGLLDPNLLDVFVSQRIYLRSQSGGDG